MLWVARAPAVVRRYPLLTYVFESDVQSPTHGKVQNVRPMFRLEESLSGRGLTAVKRRACSPSRRGAQ